MLTVDGPADDASVHISHCRQAATSPKDVYDIRRSNKLDCWDDSAALYAYQNRHDSHFYGALT